MRRFGSLTPAQQEIARGIFGRLIEVGRGTLDTRRTVRFAELVPPGHDPGAGRRSRDRPGRRAAGHHGG